MPELTIDMSEAEWCETANALESKARLIERGDYGEGDEPGKNEKWLRDLRGALTKIDAALHAAGIPW